MDTLTRQERSERMSRVKGKDTRPEVRVRRLVYGLGYRYRLHAKDLPGHPDLVFRSRRKVIFVHGCFWHRHPAANCWRVRVPKSKTEFWLKKFEENVARDRSAQDALTRDGWDVLVLWECELKDDVALTVQLRQFLGEP